MSFVANPGLLIAGAILLALGILIWRWTLRHDLKGAAIDSAWQLARGRRTDENPTPIEAKLTDIGQATTITGKARRAAGTVIGHFVAQVLSLVALVMMLAGVVLMAAGIWWR